MCHGARLHCNLFVYQIFRLPWTPSLIPVNSVSYSEGVMTDAATEKGGNGEEACQGHALTCFSRGWLSGQLLKGSCRPLSPPHSDITAGPLWKGASAVVLAMMISEYITVAKSWPASWSLSPRPFPMSKSTCKLPHFDNGIHLQGRGRKGVLGAPLCPEHQTKGFRARGSAL